MSELLNTLIHQEEELKEIRNSGYKLPIKYDIMKNVKMVFTINYWKWKEFKPL
uniref:Uncharacterized protein n=1 Tax=Lepeophtheirus salmonis TaxID=72036 RepID=A0A0K2UK56_LEPSM